jgi:hypothetical protein
LGTLAGMTYGNQGYPGGYPPYGPNQPGSGPGQGNQGVPPRPGGDGEPAPYDPFAPPPTYQPPQPQQPPPGYPPYPPPPRSEPPAQQPFLAQPPPPVPPADPTGLSTPSGPTQLYFPPKPPRRRSRVWLKVLAGVGVAIVLAGLLVGSYLLVKGTGGSPQAHSSHPPTSQSPTSSPSPTRSPLDISTRTADNRPLTVSEVFPSTSIQPDPGRSTTYQVLKADNPLANCAAATNGQIGPVLTRYGCNQVIRATLATGDNAYAFTAGICNMADSAGAQAAVDQITSLGKAGKGGFTGLAAPGAGAKLDKSPTLYALQAYGHYVLYIVIGLASGATPASNATTQQIVQDVVPTYLTGVIDKRKNNGN